MLIKSPLLTNHICSKYTLKIVIQSTLTPTSAGSEYKKSFKNRWCVTFVRCLWKLWSHELTQVGQMSHIVWPRRFLLNKFVLILLMKVRTSLWYNIYADTKICIQFLLRVMQKFIHSSRFFFVIYAIINCIDKV